MVKRPPKRMGIIAIDTLILTDSPDAAAQLFGKMQFFPTRAVHDFCRDQFIYEGYSPHFDEVDFGQQIPAYLPEFRQTSAGEIELVRMEKLENGSFLSLHDWVS